MVNGHGNVWVNPNSVTNLCFYKTFQKRLEDQFVQRWFEKARSSTSLSTLNILKQEYSFGTYLSLIKSPNMRRIYVRLRLNYGILNHSRINNPSNQLCKLCDSGFIENITHFLCECPKLKQERDTFLQSINSYLPLFDKLSNDDKIKVILNLDTHNTSIYRVGNISSACINLLLSYY